jgi:hypothetical protein
MLYVPRHLPNKLEYKVVSCISVHYQSRMTSNGIAITPSHPLTVVLGTYSAGRGGSLGAFGCLCLGNVVLGIDPCLLTMYTSHAGCDKASECVGGLQCRRIAAALVLGTW